MKKILIFSALLLVSLPAIASYTCQLTCLELEPITVSGFTRQKIADLQRVAAIAPTRDEALKAAKELCHLGTYNTPVERYIETNYSGQNLDGSDLPVKLLEGDPVPPSTVTSCH